MNDAQGLPVKMAETLKVVRNGGAARLYIDGKLFEYATDAGFTIHPSRDEMPGVSLRISAYRVEVIDDVSAPKTMGGPSANAI